MAPLSWIRTARVWGRTSVPLANFLAAGSIALVTAILALVVEDAVPLHGSPEASPWRLAALGGSLLLLWLVLSHRTSTYQRTGTLFYVRTLASSMEDWHADAVSARHRYQMSLRSVTPWIDLSQRSATDVVDLVGTCASTSATLNLLINTDRDDTGYTLAPNMLWPVALAIGANLPTVPDLQLLELDGPGVHASNGSNEVIWKLPAQPPPPGLVERELITSGPISVDGPRPGATRVGVMLAFSRKATEMDLPGVFRGFGVREYHVIRPHKVGPDLRELAAKQFGAQQLMVLTQVLPREFARLTTEVGNRELVVAAALPKTLALALGWGLAQVGCAFFTDTHFVLFNGCGKPFLPVRVHPAQPAQSPIETG
ncbi:MAG: hypothetical protein HKP61_22380 [Dactylosporangium sp.]|nr:hypothetical protein [Dactylosporangium sp.]NNJ63624.1 hypothetical protein [Dactylosporangium sp.]